MNILGIAGLCIDASSALIKNDKVVAAIEEERIKRVKHISIIQSGGLPYESIETCLKIGNINYKDIDHVGYFFQPFREYFSMSLFRLLRSYKSPSTFLYYQINYLDNLRRHLLIKKILEDKCNKNVKFNFFSHHLTHAASVYYPSPFEESAILVIDAISEIESSSLYYAKGNKIKRLLKYNFPHSLGFLYSMITDYLGFKSNNDEYKVMGLASYGQPEYYNKLKNVVKVLKTGEIKINFKYFNKHFRGKKYFSEKFIKEFGSYRLPDENIEQRHINMASSIQKLLEEIVFLMLKNLKKLTGSKNICLSGGVALNCKMNGLIIESRIFENVHIEPAPHDAGSSLGAAFLVKHQILNNRRIDYNLSPYLGLSFTNNHVKKILEKSNINYQYYENIAEITAKLLADKKLIGWFQGRDEWGPRALGSRSILADPTFKDMKDIVNKKIKNREEFRPFAPVVIEEEAKEYFDIKENSPYMLSVVKVKKKAKDLIPAVVHVDGTARPQTLSRKQNQLLYELLINFKKEKGIPVLLNTSFNVNKEPNVHTPEDALRCFFSTGLDFLIMGNYLIKK